MRQRPTRSSKALLGIILAAVTTFSSAAQDNFQIRTRVDLVVVPVTVKGPGDKLVAGLSKEDFHLFENGRPQQISNFAVEPVPISAVILLDTGMNTRTFEKIQNTTTAMAGAFTDADEVTVYRFDTHLTKLVNFTNDMAVVEAAMDRLKDIEPSSPSVTSGPFNMPGPAINGIPITPGSQTGVRIESKGTKILHDAVYAAADDLARRPIERRKMVLIVSDGRASGSDHSYDQTLARLLDNNIQVYSIGMELAFLARRLSVLDDYARATGGDAYFVNSTNAMEKAYTRSAEAARNQYVLGYFSDEKAPGPLRVFREIEVRTTRPKLTVLHRKGYYQSP